ncbi:MAG UNVERIFIED_CONTAM: hypothetical protein LVQ98_08510 [Rickettsiaceae bacterium]|jgi:hypothetical protein
MDKILSNVMIFLIVIFCFVVGLLFQKFVMAQDFRISYISQAELIELEEAELAKLIRKNFF